VESLEELCEFADGLQQRACTGVLAGIPIHNSRLKGSHLTVHAILNIKINHIIFKIT
jgi:hypothetical protein